MSPYTPLGILSLELSSAVSMTPLMANDISLAPHLYPLLFPLTIPHLYTLFFPLAAPQLFALVFMLAANPSKIGQDCLYDSVTMIASEVWNACGILCCLYCYLHCKYVSMIVWQHTFNVSRDTNNTRSRGRSRLLILSARSRHIINPGRHHC